MIQQILHQPFAVPAMVILITVLPLAFNLVSRNPYYGFRTAQTLADPKVWYRVNQVGALGMIVSSLCYFGVAFFYPATVGRNVDFSRWLVHLGVFVLPLLLSVVLALRSASRTR